MKWLSYPSIIFFLLLMFILFSKGLKADEPKKPIKVMVIDTGVSIEHPLLKGHKRYYFSPIDILYDHYHGTGMASLVLNGEIDGNDLATSPTCEQVELYVCNYLPFFKSVREPTCLASALKYKMDIINYSSSGSTFLQDEYDSLKALEQIGTIFVTVAGNEGDNLKHAPKYPGMFSATKFLPFPFNKLTTLKNIIMVGATDHGAKWSTSNYGVSMEWMNGVAVRTATKIGDGYGTMKLSGTSISAALYTNKLLRQKCKGEPNVSIFTKNSASQVE